MLRVVFHSASDRHFHAVMKGLSVLCERLRKHGDQQFTMYHVSKLSGPDEATGVDMVEIHNDTDNVFSSALDQVWTFARCCSKPRRCTQVFIQIHKTQWLYWSKNALKAQTTA